MRSGARAHYDQLFDALLANGITPMIPPGAQELPGYLLKSMAAGGRKRRWLSCLYYAEKVFARYHPKVTRRLPLMSQLWCRPGSIWMLCAGPMSRTPAPGWWNYHKVLATASVVKRFRELGYPGTGSAASPQSGGDLPTLTRPHDLRAAEIYDSFYNRMFLDLLVTASGRWSFAPLEQHCAWETSEEDLAVIREHTVDELGINFTTRTVKAPSRPGHPHTVPSGLAL
ncbi:family 1 glycosylhydrolase [Klebsiella pneumoniae]|nr:family 1 glycosylhydrolase [Klebsiella pneumoniae]